MCVCVSVSVCVSVCMCVCLCVCVPVGKIEEIRQCTHDMNDLDTPGDRLATTERCPQIVRWAPPIAIRSPRGFHDRHAGGPPSEGRVAT